MKTPRFAVHSIAGYGIDPAYWNASRIESTSFCVLDTWLNFKEVRSFYSKKSITQITPYINAHALCDELNRSHDLIDV